MKLPKEEIFEMFESEIKEKLFTDNTQRFLKNYITKEDKKLSLKKLLEKYKTEITELVKYDKSTIEICGYVNTWWVFGEVSKELEYDIFMAEAENIGYKRTTRGEKIMPNDLFDLEIAPNTIDSEKISNDYDSQIKDEKNRKQNQESKLKKLTDIEEEKRNKKDKTKIEEITEYIELINNKIEEIKKEKQEANKIITKYYEDNYIKEKYYDRTDPEFLKHFKTGLLKSERSDDILLRKNKTIKILDAIRKEVVW